MSRMRVVMARAVNQLHRENHVIQGSICSPINLLESVGATGKFYMCFYGRSVIIIVMRNLL